MTEQCCVLVVSPTPSHPADQGNSARIQTLAAELIGRGLRLEFLYYGMEGLAPDQQLAMEAFWSAFHFVPSQPHPEPKYPRFWGVDDWCPDRLCERVRELHRVNRYDAVLVNYVWMSRVLEQLPDTFRIIDTHDLFAGRHLISLEAGIEPRWFFTNRLEEDRGFERADLLLGIQGEETADIRRRVRVDAMTVGHVMPPHFLTGLRDRSQLATFGYFGSGNPWNLRSLLEFDTALNDGAAVDWLVAGSVLKRQKRFSSGPRLLGMVDRLEDFYGVVDCVVNPMQGGTGLKIKTVEALAFGKPVIGTIDAFRGLPTRHALHQLEDAAACADAMRVYSQDDGCRSELRYASCLLFFEYMAGVSRDIDELCSRILGR